MARVRKRVWAPGKYRLKDGREWTDTPEDVRNGYEQGKAMLAAGLWIPGCWEHQPHAAPAYLSDMDWSPDARAAFAKNTFGHVAAYHFDEKESALDVEFDVPDEADARQLEKTRGYSPRLDRDYVDSRGKTWPGKVVAHVAATNVPVQTGRGPLAADLSAFGWRGSETVYLSELTPMKDGDGDGKKGEDTETKPSKESSTQLNINEMVELLRTAGFELGEPKDAGQFMAALTASVKTKQGADGMAIDDPTATAVVDAAGPPALMSALPQPVQDGLKKGLEVEKGTWVARIDGLFAAGRLNGPLHRELKARATAAELSYGPGWKVGRADWMAEVEAYEKLPEKTFHPGNGGPKDGGGADLSAASVVDRPELGGSDDAKKRQDAAAEDAERRARRLIPSA